MSAHIYGGLKFVRIFWPKGVRRPEALLQNDKYFREGGQKMLF